MKNDVVKIGEQVDLYLGKGPYYRTVVDDIRGGDILMVSIPTFRGISVILRLDQELRLFFYRDNGRYSILVRVLDLQLTEPVRMAKLKVLSDPERQQRRESFRVSTMISTILRPVVFGPYPPKGQPLAQDEIEQGPAFNISATGIAVRVTGEYSVGERIFLRIYLAWPKPDSEPLDILGEVRQIHRVESDRNLFQLGIMFIDVSEELSSHIAKFVLMEEQRRTKQSRLIEGE